MSSARVWYLLSCILLIISCADGEGPSGQDLPPDQSDRSLELPEDRAILLTGPDRKQGIDVLQPNVIEYYRGMYAFQGGQVTVMFTREKVVPLSAWERDRCGEYTMFRLPLPAEFEAENIFFYQNPDGEWSVFIKVPVDVEEYCLFINPFIERLTYFIGISRGGYTAPLPAVVEL